MHSQCSTPTLTLGPQTASGYWETTALHQFFYYIQTALTSFFSLLKLYFSVTHGCFHELLPCLLIELCAFCFLSLHKSWCQGLKNMPEMTHMNMQRLDFHSSNYSLKCNQMALNLQSPLGCIIRAIQQIILMKLEAQPTVSQLHLRKTEINPCRIPWNPQHSYVIIQENNQADKQSSL